MQALRDRLRDAGLERIAWEPRGVWQDEETQAWADELGLYRVVDAARTDPPRQPLVYTRLRALGLEARVRVSSLERVVERLGAARQAWIIMEGRGARSGAKWLRQALGDPLAEAEA